MPCLIAYVESERKATMLLILEESRREIGQLVFFDTRH